MDKLKDLKDMMSSAFYKAKAEGTEKNHCLLCDKKCNSKGEDIIEMFSSSYRGSDSYTKRMHYRCWLKTLILCFPELLIDKSLKKEVILDKLEAECK